jgi:hypothetical protein
MRDAKARLTILAGVGLVDLDDPILTGELVSRLAGKVNAEVLLFAARTKEGLLAASVAIGLEVMGEMMDAEVTEIAGSKGHHNRGGHARRAVDAALPDRARTRRGGRRHRGDVHVALRGVPPLRGCRRRAVGRVPGPGPVGSALAGVLHRRVRLRRAHHGRRSRGDRDGTKVPLGVVEGSTENAAVVRALVTSICDRGMTGDGGILFVLDGGKALHPAVKDVLRHPCCHPTLPVA